MEKESMDKKLAELIQTFLAARRESKDGMFAPITNADWKEFHAIIDCLIALK